MTPARKKELARHYIRVARDLNWKADMIEVARVAAIVTPGALAMDFWTALGSFDAMQRCADGSHPAVQNPEYQMWRKP